MKFLGQEILPIGLGTWHMGDNSKQRATEIAALQAGIEAGAQVIDTAEMYGEGQAERLVGEAIQPFSRDKVFLVSKVYPWNASQEQLSISLEQSLKRLKTDYLDMYLLHWQGTVPLEETVQAMEEVKQAGKIRAWGVSNFDVADLQQLRTLPNGRECQTNQVLYNLSKRGIEYDLLPYMREKSLPLMAYSPIAQGDSLGAKLTEQPILQEIAKQHQTDVFQILLAWVIRDPQTLAIPQSSNGQHTLNNVEAAAIHLTADELSLIDAHFPSPTTKQGLAML